MKHHHRSTPRVSIRSVVALALLSLFAGAFHAPAQLGSSVQIGGNKVGSVTDNGGGSYTVVGGGEDIWDGRDQFTFAYTEVTGDFDVRVRVESLELGTAWTKAGIMARESLSEFSRMAFPRVTPDAGANDARYAYRTGLDNNAGMSGGQHEDCTDCEAQRPGNGHKWLRLVRSGSVFDAYSSTDGNAWVILGSQNSAGWGGGNMANTLFLGLAVSRSGNIPTTTAQFRNFTFAYGPNFRVAGASSRGNPNGIRVTFTKPPGAGALTAANYSVSGGVTVTGVSTGATLNSVQLLTSTMTEGTSYTVTVAGVQAADSTALSAPTSATFTHGAGYEARSIRIAHNKTDDNGYYRNSDAVLKGIGDVVHMANGNVFPAYQTNSVFEDPLPDNGGHERFSSVIAGVFVPPTSGNYTFYCSSDDVGYVYLSTDDLPANRVAIASEPQWNGSREYINGSNQGSRGFPASNISSPQGLIGGRKYYIEYVYTEGGGGNNGSVAVLTPGGPAISNGSSPIPASLFTPSRLWNGETYYNIGVARVLQQPTNTTVQSPNPASFSVRADGTPGYTYQWQRRGSGDASFTDVPGATGKSYTLATTSPADNQAQYRCVVRNEFSETNSAAVILTVETDTTAPTLVSAINVPGSSTSFDLTFSEPVNATDAVNLANYSTSGGITLTGATMQGNRVVRFTCSSLVTLNCTTISASNVRDVSNQANPIAPNSTIGITYAAGNVLVHRFDGINGGSPSDLINNAAFPNNPSVVTTVNQFEYTPPGLDNYGARLMAFLSPPVTGPYTFYVSADDGASLWLSTDINPANKVLLANEPVWASSRQWTGQASGGGRACPSPTACNISAPVTLQGGCKYYIEMIYKEGGGGDYGAATWQTPASGPSPGVPANGSAPIPGTYLSAFYITPIIVANIQSVTTNCGGRVTFSPLIIGTPPLTFQWFRNGSPIVGATSMSYTTETLSLVNNGDTYYVVATTANPAGTAQSATATITVNADTTPPALVSAAGNPTFDKITLYFSKILDAASAGDTISYTVVQSGGGALGLNSATLQADGRTVILETTAQLPNTVYEVSVNGNLLDFCGTPAADATLAFRSQVIACGGFVFETYNTGGGTAIGLLTNNANFPNNPDSRRIINTFDTRAELGTDNFRDNYGGRVRGVFVPPTSGNYVFYLHSDDASQLFLNPNGPNPAGKVLITEETGCCRDWPSVASAPIYLAAGGAYYIEGLFKEGGGGDYIRVGVRPQGSADAIAAISLAQSGQVAPPGSAGGLTITQQPASVTQPENSVATFSVAATGPYDYLRVCYQWQRKEPGGFDFVDIPGATSTSITVDPTTLATDNGAQYRCVIGMVGDVTNSAVATLNLFADTVGPALISAAGTDSMAEAIIRFNERMDAASVLDAINYTIPGLSVISATLGADERTVTLTTTPQDNGRLYTIIAANVLDRIGNPITVSNFASFVAYSVNCAGALMETYNAGGGTAVSILTNHPTFPDSPRDRFFIPTLYSRFAYPNDSNDNYGGRMRALFVPPTSGNWIFYIASDDASALYLNPNGLGSAGKQLLTEELGCCNPFAAHASAPIALTAGQRYYIEALWKEGGGGDYCAVAAKLDTDPTDPNTLQPIPTDWLRGPALPTGFGGTAAITQQPANLTANESGPATFTVAGTTSGSFPVCYQWQRRGVGQPDFTDIAGAQGAAYTIPTVSLTADNGAQFRCVLGVPGTRLVSAAATLTVRPDTTAPFIVSAASLIGTNISLCFNEALDPLSANDAINYVVNGGSVGVASATLRPDGRSVILEVFGLGSAAGTPFVVQANGVLDLAVTPNLSASSATGAVYGLNSLDIGVAGDPQPGGGYFTCSIQVTAGGSDIWNNQDGFNFIYSERTGNFDVRVRVESLVAANPWSKAGLMARENLTPGSRNLNAIVDPPAVPTLDGQGSGANAYEANYRDVQDGGPGNWPGGVNSAAPPYPNAWIRLARYRNVFTAYRSSDGVNWTQLAQTTQTYPNSIYVGLATCSHSLSFFTTAVYQDFAFLPPPTITQEPVSATNECSSPASLSVAVSGDGPFEYQWRKAGVDIPGATGSTLNFAPAVLADNGAYDVVILGAGGSVTSAVATLTVVDTTRPLVTCTPSQTVPCGTNWTFGSASATDSCDASPVVTIFSTTTNTTCGNMYAAARVWQAIDGSGNASYCTQTVTVVDTVAPTIACPTGFTRYCLGPDGIEGIFSATASDVCQGSATVVCTPPSGYFFPVGTNVVTCVATDACGNTNSCSFNIVILPNPFPTWTNLASFAVATNTGAASGLRSLALTPDESTLYLGFVDGTNAAVRKVDPITGAVLGEVILEEGVLPNALAADDRGYFYLAGVPGGQFQIYDGATMTQVNSVTPAGSARVGGLHVRREGSVYYLYLARQSATAATVQRIRVTDPALVSFDLSFGTSGTFNVRTLFPSAAGLRGLDVDPAGNIYVADSTNNLVYRIASSLSSGGSGAVLNPTDVAVKDSRVYVSRLDGVNSSVAVLRVPDLYNQGSILTGYAREATEGFSSLAITADGRLIVADQVYSNLPPDLVLDRVLGSEPIATNLAIVAPAALTIECGSPIPVGASNQAQFAALGGFVTCQDISISYTDTALTPGPLTGTITRTYTAVDQFANTATSTQTITVPDTTAPTIACPADVVTNTTSIAGQVVSFVATSTDVCNPSPVVTCTPASGTTFPFGFTTVTCVALDGSGNSNSCSFTIAVQLCQTTNYLVNATVPDNDLSGLASTKYVASPVGVLTDVNVRLHITNGYNGDLYAYLVHESGFSVLLNRVGRTADDSLGYADYGLDITLDDQATNDVHNYRVALFGTNNVALAGVLTNSWQPDARNTAPFTVLDTDARSQFLTNFNGLNPNGEWTLYVADVSGVDIATLVSWGLEFCGYPPVPLAVSTQSTNTTIQCTSNVTFSVTTTGTTPKTNQWYYNGSVISGATAGTLTLTNLSLTSAGTYTMRACNMAGCITSAPIALTVIDTIAPAITVCPPPLTNCAVGFTGTVPDLTGGLTAVDACTTVTKFQLPAAGTAVPVGNTNITVYALDTSGNSNGCVVVLTVSGPPVIASQPQNQFAPVGNGAVFSVTASSVLGQPTYQWENNGSLVPNATNSTYAISNLTLAADGTLVRVIVSNCAGSTTSTVARLTVNIVSGIAFNFDTPGQFTNNPYAVAFNDWMNSALPAVVFESPTGGVGNLPGSGALDLTAASGDNGSTLLPLGFDFSLPGKTIYVSTMIKLKPPTSNNRAIQLGLITATNVNNAWQQVNANNGLGFMSVILQSTVQPNMNYSLRAQHKVISGTTTIEATPVNSPTNVLSSNVWYRLTAKFTNVKGAGNAASNFTVEATLQNMGTNGLTPGAIALGMAAINQTNIDLVSASRLFLCIRSAAETGGSDLWDNISISSTNGPVHFVEGLTNRTILHGRPLRLEAYVNGEGMYAYQWQRSNSGSGFVNLPNGTAWKLYVPAVSAADNGAHYRVVVTGPSNTVSSTAQITVAPDALDLVSIGSVDGSSVGLQFDQVVDPVTAANPANYLINGVPAAAARVYQSLTDLRHIVPEGTRVLLTPASVLSGAVTVSVAGVQDASGNSISGTASASGSVAGMLGTDVNPYVAAPPGQQYSFATGQFEVAGGGVDIWNLADSFRYVYRQVSGNFDVQVRVAHMDLMRAASKAGIEVRASLDPFSPQVFAGANPQLPVGRNYIEGSYEQFYNVNGTAWGATSAISYPNVWIRLRRVGDTFYRYSATNGLNWVLDGQLTLTPGLPDQVYLGLAVCSANNGFIMTGYFDNYGSVAGYSGATIDLVQQPSNVTTSAPNAAVLTALATLSGPNVPAGGELAYSWQRSNGSGGWTNLPGTGTTNNVLTTTPLVGSDNGAQFRVIVSAAGAQSVTSAVATVTVTGALPPTIAAGHVPTNSVRNIILIYSEPVGSSALSAANYSVTNGPGAVFNVTGAAFLNGDPRVVQLTTDSDLVPGPYGVLVNNVQNLAGTSIAPNTVRLVYQLGFGTGAPFVVEVYGGLPAGGAITDLVNNFKFGGGNFRSTYPEFVNYSNVFGVNGGAAAFPDTLNAYGVRMFSWFVPPSNGTYRFYLRADDFAQFWMNTNPAASSLPADGIIASTQASPPRDFSSPVAEQALFAFDNNPNTKYLNSGGAANRGAVVTPAMGASVVTGVRITTANDTPDRDPITFRLEGTTGEPGYGPWTLIGTGATGVPTNRFAVGPAVAVDNATAYTSYRITFPLNRNGAVAIMQVAEIELLDTNGVDVTGRGALPRILLGANNPNYVLANCITNDLIGGQPYYVELRFKDTTGGDGGAMAVRADTTVPPATEVAPGELFRKPTPYAVPTPVQIELYTGLVQGNAIANGRIEDLRGATTLPQVIAGLPNVSGYSRHFGFSTNLANSSFDNYYGRLYAYYVAPSNGLYKFYLRCDDSAELWMNTNSVNSTDPAGITLLGNQERFINANYWLMAQNISLAAGQRYYMEGRWREGTGGDGLTVMVTAQGDTATPWPYEMIPFTQLELATNVVRYGPVQVAGITPSNPTVSAGQSIVFQAVGISGTPPYNLVWLKNGQPIMAGLATFTNQPVTLADNGAVITLLVTNLFSRAEASSIITVLPDSIPPLVTNAVGSQYQEFVTVYFNSPLDPLTANLAPNYQLNNGVTVLSALQDPIRSDRVSLRTTPQVPGTAYTVTVNGVKDVAGNAIAPNSTVNFRAWTWGGCGFLVELFTNITGGAVANLIPDTKYVNNLPDVTYYTNLFGVGRFAADTGLNNYGSRVSAYVVPPSNGLYRFYIRGDDGTQLFMNTNGPDARLRTLIARSDGANSGTYSNGTGNGVVGTSISPILSLTNGSAYYIELLHKEGGGGDHAEVVFRAVDATGTGLPPAPATPAAADLSPTFAPFFAAPGNPDAVQLVISQSPPADLYVNENDLIDLRLVASIRPPSAVLATCYQWQKETAPGSGTFTNIPGAVSPVLPTFAALLAEDGLKYRLIASLPAPQVFTTTLHVAGDIAAPTLAAVSSLDGTNLHLCFSEVIDRLSGTAEDTAQYLVLNNGNFVPVLAAFLRTNDERTVILNLATPVSGEFSVDAGVAGGIQDMAFNFGLSSATGKVQNFVAADTGAPAGAGSSFSCREGEIDVIAGGSDIWGASDIGHQVLRPICGDFDVWVRLQRLDRATGDNDGITKAGLMVRESWSPDARKVQVLLEPPAVIGGREAFEAGRRRGNGGDTAAWDGGNGNSLIIGRAGIPNGWVRIKRTGNLFQAFRSADGVTWSLATTNNVILSNVVYVGLAATAHIPSPSAATTFAQFRDLHLPPAPTILTAPAPVDQTVGLLTPLTWSVTASNPANAGPLTYTWRRNGENIPGATNATFSIAGTSVADAGRYTVVVGNDGGCVSADFTLNILNGLPQVVNDQVTATQDLVRVTSPGTLLGNDSDPEFQPLSLLGVSGSLPGQFQANFEDGLVPANSALFGTPLADPGAHVGDDGSGTNKALHLTDLVGSSFGAYVINDLSSGRLVNQLEVRWRQRIGGAVNNVLNLDRPGADGMSFNWASDLPVAPGSSTFEDGIGTGLSVTFDQWDSGSAEAPAVEIRWKGVIVSRDVLSADQRLAKDFLRKDRFVDASVSVLPDGTVTVKYDGRLLNTRLPDFVGIRAGRFLWGARTGGAFDNHWIDDVSILTLTRDTLLPPAPIGTPFAAYSADFNDTNSNYGAGRYGNAYLEATSGVGGSGSLHLTDNLTSQSGSFVLPNLSPGLFVNSFTARFDLQIGSGSAVPADGFSINFANDLPDNTSPTAEDGVGTGLSVCIDSYPGGTTPAGPAIRLKYGGGFLAHVQTPLWSSTNYIPVEVRLDADGTVDVIVAGTNVFANFPTGFVPTKGRFGFYARTGGEHQRHWMDNLQISGTTVSTPVLAGWVAYTNGVVQYTPPLNACGTDRYYYVANDGQIGGYSIGYADVRILESIPQNPLITSCPTNRTFSLTTNCTLSVPDFRPEIAATDNCCCLTYTQTPAPGTALPLGSHTITFVATDTMGLTATCTAVVVVQDVAPPLMTCPTLVTVECQNNNSAVVNYTMPTATDNCSSTVVCVPPAGSVFALGNTTVSCQATDPSANATNCLFTVRVVDTTPPTVACQSNITVFLPAGVCQATVTYVPATYTDCSTSTVVSCSPPSGTSYYAGTNVVTCTVTDGSGNSTPCSFLVSVIEVIPAFITPPADVTILCDSSTLPAATGTAFAVDNCDTNVAVTYQDGTVTEITTNSLGGWSFYLSGSPSTATAGLTAGPAAAPLGSGSLRLAVGSNGDSLAQARITNYSNIRLDQLSELSYFTYTVTNNGNGEAPYMALNIDSDGNGVADDVLVFEPEFQGGYTFAVPNQGAVTLGVWQRWDAKIGGWWSQNQPGLMSPGGGVKPLSTYLAVHRNARIVNTSSGLGGVRLVAGSGLGGWENFDGYVDRVSIGASALSSVFDFDDVAGATYRTITRTWSAVDDSGNRTASSQFIKLIDLTAPVVTCSSNRLVEATSTNGAVVTFASSATDNCDTNLVVLCSPVSGSVFSLGVTTVTCLSTDWGANTGSCTFTVTVADSTPPSIVCSTNRLLECTGLGGAPVTFVTSAVDIHDPNPAIVCSPASGATFPLGTNTVTCTATDLSGNTANCSFQVVVRDTTRPVLTACAPNQNVAANANCQGTVPSLTGQVTASDLCGSVVVSQVPAAGFVFSGSTAVTLTVTDGSGNSTSCVATVTVVDQTGPTVACPAPITVECATPAGTVVTFTATAVDNCTASPTIACSPASGSVFAPGTNVVTCVATDAAGNSNTCTFAVRVIDTTAPTLCSTPAFVASAGGEADNFGGTEAASPSANLQDLLLGLDLRGFDDATADSWFAHTLSGLPADISEATLRIRLRADVASATNDTIELLFATAGGGWLPQEWLRRLGTNQVDGVPGLRPGLWTNGSTVEIVLNLRELPNANGTTTDLIPTLRAQRYLDIVVQNGTLVDYVVLETKSCQCGPDITLTASAATCGAVATFTAPVFNDNCDTNVAVVCTPPSGALFPIGTTTVECVGTDDSGNAGRCSFNVVVVEQLSLTIEAAGSNLIVSWPIPCEGSYQLQTTPVIGTGAVWTDVSAPVFILNGRQAVQLPNTGNASFYRLRRP